jgi:hypothetical protein
MNLLLRTLFFASALAPAVLISAIARVWRTGGNLETWCWVAASATACVLPILVLVAAARQSAEIPFVAKKIESQEWVLVVVVISYFVPLITKIESLEVFAWIFLIAAVLLSTLEAIPTHPVLHVLRYRFYKVEGANGTVYTLITRRRLLNASDLKKVRQLSPQLLLDI